MTTLKDLQEQAERLGAELRTIKDQITEMTDLPDGWSMDMAHGLRAGGVTIYGTAWDDACVERREVAICAYDNHVFIKENDGSVSSSVDQPAMLAAIKALGIKKAEQKARRETARATRKAVRLAHCATPTEVQKHDESQEDR
jgi:hypothetical protein